MAYDEQTVAEHLPQIGAAVQQVINETFGPGLQLAIVIGDGDKASMVCNTDPESAVKMIDAAMGAINDLPDHVKAQIEQLRLATKQHH